MNIQRGNKREKSKLKIKNEFLVPIWQLLDGNVSITKQGLGNKRNLVGVWQQENQDRIW